MLTSTDSPVYKSDLRVTAGDVKIDAEEIDIRKTPRLHYREKVSHVSPNSFRFPKSLSIRWFNPLKSEPKKGKFKFLYLALSTK